MSMFKIDVFSAHRQLRFIAFLTAAVGRFCHTNGGKAALPIKCNKKFFFAMYLVAFLCFFSSLSAQTHFDGKSIALEPNGQKRLTCDTKYYYVNGIGTPYEKAVAQAQRVADTLNASVILVYSAAKQNTKHPKKAKFGDILSTIPLRMGKKNKAVDSLYCKLRKEVENHERVLVYGHSRGALIAYFATKKLKRRIAKDERKEFGLIADEGYPYGIYQVSVLSVGGFAPKARKWKVSICEAVNRYDLVPFFAGNPAKGSRLWNISKKRHSLVHYLGYIHYFDSVDNIRKYHKKRVSDVPK
ncbi:MAG: hypothetical protein ACKVTZ_09915 [Bacteroidia bacterium]